MSSNVVELPKSITALDVLRKCNERGEVGYADVMPGREPTKPCEWPAFEDALDRGWLRYGYDASPDIFSRDHGQKRTVYIITAAGRAALCGSPEVAL